MILIIEKRVYSPWAYTENDFEKREVNKAIYNELINKYKITNNITRNYQMYNSKTYSFEPANLDNYDIAFSYVGSSCGNIVYQIIKNAPNLSNDELALLCDEGNLCFGHVNNGSYIRIFTD